MRTPEQNEALLHREVERAQARRWEPEDVGEDTVECAWCTSFYERDSGFTTCNGEECCSETCRMEYDDDLLAEEE